MLIELKIAAIKVCLALSLCGANSPTTVVFEGDSLITGYATWPITTQQTTAWRTTWHHVGVSGSTTQDVISRGNIQKLKPAKGTGVLFLNIGTNDIRSEERDAAATYANIKSMWATGRRSGYKIVAFTMHSVPCSAKCESERVKLNAAIRSDPALYDALIPLDTLFPSMDEPGMFFDRIHFDKAGNDRVVKAAAKATQKLNR